MPRGFGKLSLACARLEGCGRQPISGLPEIGISSAQVGYSRLAMAARTRAALCFETHRRAATLVPRTIARLRRCSLY